MERYIDNFFFDTRFTSFIGIVEMKNVKPSGATVK